MDIVMVQISSHCEFLKELQRARWIWDEAAFLASRECAKAHAAPRRHSLTSDHFWEKAKMVPLAAPA